MSKRLLWQEEMSKSIRNPEDLLKLGAIDLEDLPAIREIHEHFPFSITPYYARLIDWKNPDDPLKRIVAPSLEETSRTGFLDVGGEAESTQDEGIQMKYPSTALLLPIPACFAYCRFCFRKRLFNPEVKGEEILKNIRDALSFLKRNPSINNVLITGGDPLLIKTPVLKKFVQSIREIEHIKIIRFGTRGLVFLPSRFTSDSELIEVFKEFSVFDRRIYLVNHFSHPRELTEQVGQAANLLLKAGVILANQAAILKGVNDDPLVLRELLNKLAEWGITPYYLFQCKFIEGSGHFRVPLWKSWEIFSEATRGLNGLAKRVKFIMAHASGKIEILGVQGSGNDRRMYFKYHQARKSSLIGEIFSFALTDDAYWLDDLPGSTEFLSSTERRETE